MNDGFRVLSLLPSGTVTWLHHDHLGSAVAGTNSAGAVVWRESEQPFGEDWTTAAANDNQAGYTGHVEDAATGLTYMQARYYDPVIGRFLSIDPVGFSPGRPDMFNRYAYAANDPVNMWDPDGRKCEKTKDGDQKCSTVVKEGQSESATKRAEKAQAKIDKAYTKTVNDLLKKPEKEVTITVGESSFKTTAGEIAQTLIETEVELDGATPKEKGGNYSRAVTQGGVLSGVGLTPKITINQTAWTQNTFGSTRSADVFDGLMNTLTHEPMHLLPGEKALIPEINKLGGPAFNQAHQLEYYMKAEELLGR